MSTPASATASTMHVDSEPPTSDVSSAEAFLEVLIRTHQGSLWRYLRFLGCDRTQADDLTQETFLAVLRKPFEDRGPGQTASYLRTVARNLFLMTTRRRDAEFSTEVIEATAAWEGYIRDTRPTEWLEALDGCVESVENPRARRALDLCYRDNLSRSEMAASLDMTEDGVKTLLRRTRDLLRRCLERSLDR